MGVFEYSSSKHSVIARLNLFAVIAFIIITCLLGCGRCNVTSERIHRRNSPFGFAARTLDFS